MAEFLTTNGTSYNIENIIIDAKKNLTLVSPYLQLSKTFYERLKDATNRGVQVKIIYGKDELKPNERNSLAELKNIELYYFENLHAKCYFNETRMVITSMNMYDFSEKRNREMGVLIDQSQDKVLFEKAVNETHSILQSSEKEELKKANRTISQPVTEVKGEKPVKQIVRGYCIRCENRIDYNSSRPYCTTCFTSWSKFENPYYQENVCHRCGEYGATSMEKPQCYDCYTLSEYEYDMAKQTDPLMLLFNNLSKSFKNEKITKADTYIYFIKVLPSIDAFIKEKEISLKYTLKGVSDYEIKQLDKKIRSTISDYKVILNPPTETYNYYLWEIDLKDYSSKEIKTLIERIRGARY